MNLFWLKPHTPWFLLTDNKCISCAFLNEVTESSTSFLVWQQTAHVVSLWACLFQPSGGISVCLCLCNKEHSATLFTPQSQYHFYISCLSYCDDCDNANLKTPTFSIHDSVSALSVLHSCWWRSMELRPTSRQPSCGTQTWFSHKPLQAASHYTQEITSCSLQSSLNGLLSLCGLHKSKMPDLLSPSSS